VRRVMTLLATEVPFCWTRLISERIPVYTL
jgi:hypothetical protein